MPGVAARRARLSPCAAPGSLLQGNHEEPVSDPGFLHLHVHSSYSLLEGAMTIGKLAELAKADPQPALALTDTGTLVGGLEFSHKMAGVGIQPIIGCALAVDFGDLDAGPRSVGTADL